MKDRYTKRKTRKMMTKQMTIGRFNQKNAFVTITKRFQKLSLKRNKKEDSDRRNRLKLRNLKNWVKKSKRNLICTISM